MEKLIFLDLLHEKLDGKSHTKSRPDPTRGLEMIWDQFVGIGLTKTAWHRRDSMETHIPRTGPDAKGVNQTQMYLSMQRQQDEERVTSGVARRPLVMFFLLSLRCRSESGQVRPQVGRMGCREQTSKFGPSETKSGHPF